LAKRDAAEAVAVTVEPHTGATSSVAGIAEASLRGRQNVHFLHVRSPEPDGRRWSSPTGG
jgi:hypothetical protein